MFPDGVQERRLGLDVTADQETRCQIDDWLLGRVLRIDALRQGGVVRQSRSQGTDAGCPVLGVHPEQFVQARRGGSRGAETDQGQGGTQRGGGDQLVSCAVSLNEQPPTDLLRGGGGDPGQGVFRILCHVCGVSRQRLHLRFG